MDNEPYRDMTHREACQHIYCMLQERGFRVKREAKLPNGKVADVLALNPFGDWFIFEVKTVYRDSDVTAAYDKYYRHCNYLFVVVPHLTAARFEACTAQLSFQLGSHAVGVMGLERDTQSIYRTPRFHRLLDETTLDPEATFVLT